jgi:hypothetical protein
MRVRARATIFFTSSTRSAAVEKKCDHVYVDTVLFGGKRTCDADCGGGVGGGGGAEAEVEPVAPAEVDDVEPLTPTVA